MKKTFLLITLILFTFYIKAQAPLWGMTSQGGIGNQGVIFKTDSSGNNQTVVHNFIQAEGGNSYYGTLTQAIDGKLYGITLRGGTGIYGVLFQYDPVNHTYSKKFEFGGATTGANPMGSLILASDGKLYGMTQQGGVNNFGVIFQYDPITNTLTKKYDFAGISSGGSPYGSLVQASDGKLYGLTQNGGANALGVLFQFDPTTNLYTKKIDFNGTANGSEPFGSLIQATDGKLYGMTSKGGTSNVGVMFQYDISTNILTKKFDFNGASNGGLAYGSLIQATDGMLYGMSYGGGVYNKGVLFQFDISNDAFTKKLDFSGTVNGSKPYGSLMEATDGKLYGMTSAGGINYKGDLFQFDPITNNYTTKLSFDGIINGSDPRGSLMQASDGKMYGMTYGGGLINWGVMFQFDPITNNYFKKLNFGVSPNGDMPHGSLIQATDGKLYGMTNQGGIANTGVLFQVDPGTNAFINKMDFGLSTNVGGGLGSLIQASDGKIYGMGSGGLNNKGTIFQYDPMSNILTNKLDFAGASNGEAPWGSLCEASDGMLYGLTQAGGANNSGVLFQYNPLTDVYIKKYDFNYSSVNGHEPRGSLTEALNGKLYGMTRSGGVNGMGVLFEYNPVTNIYTKKIDFSGAANGKIPESSLVLASNGKLYGMTMTGGANDKGVLFEYDPNTNILLKKVDFNGINGDGGMGTLMQASNGKLYGMTLWGGISGQGVLFQYDLITDTYIKKCDFVGSNGSNPYYTNLIEVISPPTINTLPVNTTNCIMGPVAVSYAISGAYATGNVFTAQLSDASGSFASAVSIGSLTSISSGTISATIPALTTPGISYRIRVVSTNPSIIGIDNGSNLIVNAKPTLTITASNSICIGSSANIEITGANTYTWSTGATTNSITETPAITTTYSVIGTDINNCSNTQTVSVTVDNSCADVWPGDANSDGTADNLDVLELGLHYTQTGSARASVSNTWQSYFANNWIGSVSSGKNLNHSDCNGDGTINNDDTLAIYNNYGLTHAFKATETTTVNPQLSIVPDQNYVDKGNWGTASIYYGDASNPISNVNGLAFTLNYDNSLIEIDSTYIVYENSFIGLSNQNLKFRKPDFANGKIYTAITHTNNTNVSGYGKVATLHYKIKSSLSTDDVLNLSLMQANQSNASGTIVPLTSGSATLMAVGASVGLIEFLNDSYVSINPNPTNSHVVITSTTDIEKVEVTNLTGQVLVSEMVNDKTHQLNLETLANGVYFVKVYNSQKQMSIKKLVVQK